MWLPLNGSCSSPQPTREPFETVPRLRGGLLFFTSLFTHTNGALSMFNGSKKLELRTVGTIRSVFGIADHTDARPRIAVLTEEDLVPLKSTLITAAIFVGLAAATISIAFPLLVS